MRYEITLTQLNRKPEAAISLYRGDDYDSALRAYRDATSRSQGEWTNHVFLGQSVLLYDNGIAMREYVGDIECKRDEAAASPDTWSKDA